MKNTAQQKQESASEKLMQAALVEIHPVRIRQGASEAARGQTHLFVPGNLYGGKIGSMLCKRPWREKIMAKGSEHLPSMCPQCLAALRQLCAIVAGMPGRSAHLFDDPDSTIPPLTPDEILHAMTVLRERKYRKSQKPEQESLLDMEQAKAPVRKTLAAILPGEK